MDSNDLKKQLKRYVDKNGAGLALGKLLALGVGASTASRLVDGTYKQKIPHRRIRDAIAAVLREEKAS